ncbi:MAG TPA: MarR family transcriptional regulator [Rectinemataceae bacterium]|nr:MarR family transcriptional regulator [Rectinemataceae bacterium]
MKGLELVELMVAFQRRIMKRLGHHLAGEGLSTSEGFVLWRLHKHGARRVSEIAASSGLPPSTLTSLLDRLVEGGWVAREPDPDDRRAIIMQPTPKLEEFARTSLRSVGKDLENSFRSLPSGLVDRLIADLGLVIGCFEEEESQRK